MNDIISILRWRYPAAVLTGITALVALLTACQSAYGERAMLTDFQSVTSTPTETATATVTSSPTATATSTEAPTITPFPTTTATATPTATPTETATATHTPTATPTATSPPSPTVTATATAPPAATITSTKPPPTTVPEAEISQAPQSKISTVPSLVLANYFAWFDTSGWDDCNISAGDRPVQPYNSDDPAAIRRHVEQARSAGVDGFTLNWFAPGGRTDRNFATLLDQSRGTDFRSTVVFSRHIWHGAGATQADVVAALRHILDSYAGHPNFLRIDGKPVLFFTDVYRVPRAGSQTSQQAWAGIRAQIDPNHDQWWIAEGLDASYLQVMDGLYVHKVTHASSPDDYTKASGWARRVRSWEEQTGRQKLWVATLMPGWDDRNAGCRPDVRVPSHPHRRARNDGAFYRATFDAAMQSAPDILWVNSFNEWIEGTHIEPSAQYGNTYLTLTRHFVQQFMEP